jgi:spermidine/putrescine transport system permease protein
VRSRAPILLALPGLAWLAVFFGVAFYAIVSVAFGNTTTLYEPVPFWNPGEWNVGWMLEALEQAAPGGRVWDDFLRTTTYVVVAVGLSLAIGYPVAWYTARHAGRWRTALLIALVLPFWISYLMRMFAWTNLLASDGYAATVLEALSIDSLLESVGLFEPGGWLGGQHVTVILGLVYGYVPYLILPLYAALDRIDTRTIEAARDLGASPAGAFRHVVLPASRTAVLAGIVIIALPMYGDYYTADLMSGAPRTYMIGNVINDSLLQGPNKPLGAALTLLLSAFLLAAMVFYLRQLRADQRALEGT